MSGSNADFLCIFIYQKVGIRSKAFPLEFHKVLNTYIFLEFFQMSQDIFPK